MTEAPKSFNLENFEYLVSIHAQEKASKELLFLLSELDRTYGRWSPNISARAQGDDLNHIHQRVCSRLAGAISQLFCSPSFVLTDEGWGGLMLAYRWLAAIFAVSGYGHGDHIIYTHNLAGSGDAEKLNLSDSAFKVFCLSYHPDSCIELDLDRWWATDWKKCAMLLFCILSSRTLPTPAGYEKREKILAWLPEKLKSLETTEHLPDYLLHEAYMSCSYAQLAQKHNIKRELNRLIRNTLLKKGYQDVTTAPPSREKPLAFIILEWFNSQHSVYRTHSVSLRALAQHYTLHAIAEEKSLDQISMAIFSEVHFFTRKEIITRTIELAHQQRPDLIYYPGIGMFQHTLFLSNLRLAPLQIVSLGHGASTFCDTLDAFVLEQDLLADPACFGERVVPVSVGAMPFVPIEQLYEAVSYQPPEVRKEKKPFVRIAVCASIMKINPSFLQTLAEIERHSQVPIQFCFYVASAVGVIYTYLCQAIQNLLPGAEINEQKNIATYLQSLHSCELFVSPFPYGNMNSLVDLISQGIPGVCMEGPELHTHIDAALLARMGLSDHLVAHDREEYIKAVLRLVEDHAWRAELQQRLIREKPERQL
ncbi:MAG: cobalt ABC transporter permease, partial [Enterobacteriaceae bacterium]